MRLKSLTTIALALACLAAAGAAETKKDAQADTGPWPLVPEEQEILNFLRMNGGGEQGRDRRGHLTEVGVGVIQGRATLGEILTRAAKLRHVKWLDIHVERVAAADVQKLAGLKELKELVLRGVTIDSDACAVLGSLTQLETLTLNESSIDDAGLKKLEGLRALRGLGLGRTAVGDDGLATVAKFTKLQRLSLEDTKVTPRGLRAVEQLKELCGLALPNSLSDEALSHLQNLVNLSHLKYFKIRHGEVTDAGLRSLAKLTKLPELDLAMATITDEGLKHLTGMKQLRVLQFNSPAITDAGVALLANLSALESLTIYNSSMTGDGLGPLAALRNLNYLAIGPRVGAKAMANIVKFRRLRWLTAMVRGDDALAPLEEMHGLLCLDLAYSPIGDAAVPHIAKISGLTALSLRETNVGDESLPYLKKMKKLVRLRIGDTRLSLQAVDALRAALPKTDVEASSER